MRKFVTLLLVFACSAGIGFAQKPKVEKKKETVEIRLDEMCQNCVNKINKNIAFEKGVTALDINHENMSVNVTFIYFPFLLFFLVLIIELPQQWRLEVISNPAHHTQVPIS